MKDQLEALVSEMHNNGILYQEAIREFKKCFVMNVIRQCRGNNCKAAIELGMHRNTLSRLITELQLDTKQLRGLPPKKSIQSTTIPKTFAAKA